LKQVIASEKPFNMLSVPGFIRDEGIVNSLRIGIKLAQRPARLRRMKQIWDHFAGYAEYFSYTVISGTA
jgi:hypothetical protein